MSNEVEFGRRLRAIRRQKGATLGQIASATELSKSFISQIESGRSQPSTASLQRIAAALGVRVGDLFEVAPSEAEAGNDHRDPSRGDANPVKIVRADARKKLIWPGSSDSIELLTPDLQRKFEVILITAQPEGDTIERSFTHAGEELGLILEGSLEVTVADEIYVLNPGDTIYYPSHLPHRSHAAGNRPCLNLWVIAPPYF